MIQTLRVKNFRCLRDVSVDLANPVHAFIGPNDSGKSSLLLALEILSAAADLALKHASPLDPTDRDDSPVSHWKAMCAHLPQTPGWRFEHVAQDGQVLTVAPAQADQANSDFVAQVTGKNGNLEAQLGRLGPNGFGGKAGARQEWGPLLQAARQAKVVQFRAGTLALPGPIIIPQEALRFGQADVMLASVLEVLASRGDDSFSLLRKAVQTVFPNVASIGLQTVQGDGNLLKSIFARLGTGTEVLAPQLSEGILYYLAYETLAALGQPLMLMEEIETGLHPARIAQVGGPAAGQRGAQQRSGDPGHPQPLGGQ